MNTKPLRILGLVFGHVLFWGWNLLFLSLLTLGFAPIVLGDMLVASWVGMIPWSITLPAVFIVTLPLPFMVIGAWKLRSDPGRLLTLFYGVQTPLMVMCLVRIFAIGPLSAPTVLAMAVFGLSTLGLLRTVLHGFEERSAAAQGLRQMAGAASLLVGLWSGTVLGIYAVSLAGGFLQILWEEAWRVDIFQLVEGGFFVTFLLVNTLVMALYPIAMVGISLRAWQVVHRATAARLGAFQAWGVTAATLATAITLFAASSFQPQGAAFELADAALAPEATDADRQAILDREGAVREGLVAARTGPDRLFESDPDGEHVAGLYRDLLPFGAEVVPQVAWTTLMSPFLYHRVRDGWARGARRRSVPVDSQDASKAYAALFDEPMDRAERATLLASAHATWSWEEAQASLLDIGQQRVHLDQQAIDVAPHGDVATVTIHDVYRSRTWSQEEILVSFVLPEGAAVTGLWMGPVDDREAAFAHVLAPRGAAQEVYEAEVSRRVDPALLEQVGPRQYRLRAFPVLPREGEASDVWSITSEGPALHLWLEVVVPRKGDRYPLPEAVEVRNLFWDADTVRADGADRWLPASVPATDGPLAAHSAVVAGWEVTATPAESRHPTPGRTAVLIDGTFSMGQRRAALRQAIDALQDQGPVELWCTREAAVVRCPDFDPDAALFFGSVSVDEQLLDWAPDADRRVVLTDGGSYELGLSRTQEIPGDTPLWLVHLEGLFPAAYGDTVLDELTHTGGGAVGSVEELADRSDPTWVDGWRWAFQPTDAPSTDTPFTAMAGRALVGHLDRSAEEHDLAFFDAVHDVARQADVITQYSSMLVLVNERQLKALADAEARGDRFDREVLTSEVQDMSSVPEPATWLLLGLGGLAVGAGSRRQRAVSPRTAS